MNQVVCSGKDNCPICKLFEDNSTTKTNIRSKIMNLFKNILKAVKDQIKWGNRNGGKTPQEKPLVPSGSFLGFPNLSTPAETKGPSNSVFKGRRSPEQNRKRHLRRISGDSRRANIRAGLQGAH